MKKAISSCVPVEVTWIQCTVLLFYRLTFKPWASGSNPNSFQNCNQILRNLDELANGLKDTVKYDYWEHMSFQQELWCSRLIYYCKIKMLIELEVFLVYHFQCVARVSCCKTCYCYATGILLFTCSYGHHQAWI